MAGSQTARSQDSNTELHSDHFAAGMGGLQPEWGPYLIGGFEW